MYRRNCVCGYSCLTFGAGLLIGLWIESGFWVHCIGFALVIFGINLLCKR